MKNSKITFAIILFENDGKWIFSRNFNADSRTNVIQRSTLSIHLHKR